MIASMEGYMEDVKEAAPAEAYEQVAAPAEELKQHIEDCRTAEECFGPEPAIWEGYQPKHEEVCDSLDNLSKTYQSENTSTEAKAVAALIAELHGLDERIDTFDDVIKNLEADFQKFPILRDSIEYHRPDEYALRDEPLLQCYTNLASSLASIIDLARDKLITVDIKAPMVMQE